MKTLFAFALLLTTIQGSALDDFTKGNQLFTADIYKEYKKGTKDNFLLSPFSVQVVLALTQSGAKGDTAEEIRTHLHLPDSDQETKSAIGTYIKSVKDARTYQLHSANKIYVGDNFWINYEFKKIATEDYKADVGYANFSQSCKAADTINRWVEEQTRNKIHDIVDCESLNSFPTVVLINALYFQARWKHEFEEMLTEKLDFYTTETDVVKADFMNQYGWFKYHDCKELNAQFLKLPFQDKGVSLIIVLPNEKNGLSSLEQEADKVFQKRTFEVKEINLALPKFKIESEINFVDILQKLGIRKIFSDEADLSGIGGKKGELVVGKILQKTFIDVNEGGVEAAVAEDVVMIVSSSLDQNPPINFVVDHPFIFYIEAKDVVLFSGRVVNPST